MATYTVANGGGNINAASTYDGGVGVPGPGDEINFTTTSGNLTVNASTTIQDIDFSNYKGQIIFSANLTVTRNITFADAGGNATYTTLSANNVGIIKLGAGTITSNGRVWDRKFTISTSGSTPYTITLADVFNISGDLIHNNSSDVTIISNDVFDLERFNILGNYSGTSVAFLISGGQAAAVTVRFTGSANQTITMRLGLNTKIDKSGGTLTITGTNLFQTNTLTYVAGTVDTTGSTLDLRTSATYDTKGDSSPSATTVSSTGINWNIVTNNVGSPTIALLSNFTIKASITVDNAQTVTFTRPSGSGNVYLGGSLIMGTATNATLSSSTVTIIMNGTGNWSGGGTVAAPLTFDTTGTITVVGVASGGDAGVVQFNTRTLTYLNGTIITTGRILRLMGSCTLATSGMTWNTIEAGVSATITLNENLIFSGGLRVLNKATAGGTVTFTSVGGTNLVPSSTSGFTLGGTATNGNLTINFPSSSVYNIAGMYVATDGATNIGYSITVNNVTFNVSGNLTLEYTNQNISRLSGTSTQINMIGTGTVSVSRIGGNNLFYIAVPFSVNTSGTITFTSNVNSAVYFEGKTITYVSGTTTTSNSTSVVFLTGCSMDFNETNQWGVSIIISGNLTLLSNATVTNFTTSGGGTVMSGAFTINVKGNLTVNATTSGASTLIVLNGTGSQSWTATSYLSNNLTINKSSGTLTIGTNVYYQTGTLAYVSSGGTVNASTSTLNIGGNTTLNTNGITWYNFAIQAASVLTLSSDFTWSNNWTIPAGYTVSFAVSAGNLTPTSTANINFTSAQVTLKNDITVNNVTRNGGRMDNNKVNIIGNLSIVTNSTTAGTTIFEINGTGNQSWTATAYLVNPMIINKSSGTLTMGSAVYHSSNFTYTQGNVDFTTNNNVFWAGAGTYITTGLTFNTFLFASFGSNSITLGSDLYSNTFTAGGNGVINGLFNIYSQTLNINNSVSLSSTVNITFNGIFYCSGDCTFSGAVGGVSTTNANVYVGGSCFLSNSLLQVGSSNLYMVGNGVLSLPTVNFSLISNIYFDTSGKIVITGNLSKGTSASPSALIMSLIRGNVDAKKATLTLGANLTHTLTNMHKMVWGVVSLRNTSANFPTLIMNEFFCGDAITNTNISVSDTTATALNAVVTFTDSFEKIAKFVTINGITFTRPQQLLLLTNQPKKSRNRGIRYNNDLPNGIPKGDPSVQNLQTVGQSRTLLLGDPNFIKTI